MTGKSLQKRYLNRQQTADYIGLAKKTLQNLASEGKGLKFVIIDGEPQYDLAEIEAYEKEHQIF